MDKEQIANSATLYGDAPKVEAETSVESPFKDEDVQHIDPAIERRVVRKCDWRVLPPVMFVFMVTFWDRVNSE